ncbi:MAG: site-specific DNA-methyltransferase [Bacteroidales bacterium]|nr:site-specific DNA-methyltransferase [Bacteroidales bacterium]
MDCVEGLKTLPDNCIDCCVTSPPYYGLRDYGTGHWEGGDSNCDHSAAKIPTRFDYQISDKQKSSQGTNVPNHKKICPNCGAIYVDGQIGLEDSPEAYIDKLVNVFSEVFRVLKPEGTLWLNLGDSYCGTGDKGNLKDPKYPEGRNGQRISKTKNIIGLKHKDLIGIPWMAAFALRERCGFYLRQDIIWHKPNPMPESVTDRCTKSHEYIFLLSKSQRYYFDHEAIQEPATTQIDQNVKIKFGGTKYGENDDKHFQTYSGKNWQPKTKNCMEDGQKPNTMHLRREAGLPDEQYVVRNKRDVWSVNVKPDTVAHFATYPEELIRPCILAGCPKDGIVLDPFMGSGTTARVAMKLDRNYIGFELNPEYCKIINTKTREIQKELFT